MKKIPNIAALLVLAALPNVSAAGTQRVNYNIPYGSDVLIISNASVSIRADCIQDDPVTHKAILRVYTKATDPLARVIQFGLDPYNGSDGVASILTSNTPEKNARLLELATDPGIFVATTPTTSGGFVIDTGNPKKLGIAYSAWSAELALGVFIGDAQGCFLSLSVEKIGNFKSVTK